MFDIILGDFNINVFANNNSLQQAMLQYQLINYEPTHISGSLLDHVYINKHRKNFPWELFRQLLYISLIIKQRNLN